MWHSRPAAWYSSPPSCHVGRSNHHRRYPAERSPTPPDQVRFRNRQLLSRTQNHPAIMAVTKTPAATSQNQSTGDPATALTNRHPPVITTKMITQDTSINRRRPCGIEPGPPCPPGISPPFPHGTPVSMARSLWVQESGSALVAASSAGPRCRGPAARPRPTPPFADPSDCGPGTCGLRHQPPPQVDAGGGEG